MEFGLSQLGYNLFGGVSSSWRDRILYELDDCDERGDVCELLDVCEICSNPDNYRVCKTRKEALLE